MYLSSFHIENVKCFKNTGLKFPTEGTRGHAGWNVLLGVNGTGKSTLLQGMALSALGPNVGQELLRLADRDRWIRRGADVGLCASEIVASLNDTTRAGRPRTRPYEASLYVTSNRPVTVEETELRQPQLFVSSKQRPSLDAGPYSGARGWFSAGYGPFRRLSGGGQEEDQRLAWQGGPAGRHVSLFRESAALTRCEPWLKDLHNTANDTALQKDVQRLARERLKFVRFLINSLLPFGIRLGTISSQEVTFVNTVGLQVELAQLSDGYRSFLALAVDLLRQIVDADEWGEVNGTGEAASVDTEGVVFIDEADAHLHPEWQRKLGPAMCRVFPNIQFIVSTHSPFIAQAAMPGGLFVLRTQSDQVVVEQPEVSVEGWRADDVLLSPLFGLDSTRDIETDGMMAERTSLLARIQRSAKEERRLKELTVQLEARLRAPGDTLEEQRARQAMHDYVRSRLQERR